MSISILTNTDRRLDHQAYLRPGMRARLHGMLLDDRLPGRVGNAHEARKKIRAMMRYKNLRYSALLLLFLAGFCGFKLLSPGRRAEQLSRLFQKYPHSTTI